LIGVSDVHVMNQPHPLEAAPVITADRTDLSTPYVAPRNPDEDLLAEIWATVLKRDKVGVDDHFMELGGDSLSAVEVIVEIHTRLGIEIPAWTVFHQPTVAALAAILFRE
jgi:phthiocerol/phenolphthiocerol synthesis type-I polyketide synthase E